MAKEYIVILGKGRSGEAASSLAAQLGIEHIILCDDECKNGQQYFDLCNLIVVSPGIPPSSTLYGQAVASRKEIVSELEFASRHFPNKYLAITGTNGKTTTTELTTHLLKSLGIKAAASGNIGHAFSALAAEFLAGQLHSDTLAVVEVSSFQLERIRDFAPQAAVVLNVAEDHLDRYPDGIEQYAQTKEKIFNNVTAENRIYGITYKAYPAKFSINDGAIKYHDTEFVNFQDLSMSGIHNQENVIAALELISRVVQLDNAKLSSLSRALKNFSPGEHRVQKVYERNEISFIDDSKGTNPAAVIAAIKSIPGNTSNIRLILGGLDKGMDFSPLKNLSSRITKAYILGACREKIFYSLKDSLDCEMFNDFDSCVLAASKDAEPGETVLLSPGCASWDMFKNYKERGKRFQQLVKEL